MKKDGFTFPLSLFIFKNDTRHVVKYKCHMVSSYVIMQHPMQRASSMSLSDAPYEKHMSLIRYVGSNVRTSFV